MATRSLTVNLFEMHPVSETLGQINPIDLPVPGYRSYGVMERVVKMITGMFLIGNLAVLVVLRPFRDIT